MGVALAASVLCFGGVSPVFTVIDVSASVTPATLSGVSLYFLSLRLFFADASSMRGRSSSLTKSNTAPVLASGDDGLCRAGLGITVFLCELVAVEFGPVMSAELLLRVGFAVDSFVGLLVAAGLPAWLFVAGGLPAWLFLADRGAAWLFVAGDGPA